MGDKIEIDRELAERVADDLRAAGEWYDACEDPMSAESVSEDREELLEALLDQPAGPSDSTILAMMDDKRLYWGWSKSENCVRWGVQKEPDNLSATEADPIMDRRSATHREMFTEAAKELGYELPAGPSAGELLNKLKERGGHLVPFVTKDGTEWYQARVGKWPFPCGLTPEAALQAAFDAENEERKTDANSLR